MKGIVLLVDDERSVLDGLQRVLHREPYHILTASGGEAALSIMKDHKVDVVVSDNKMPGLSGIELFASLRMEYPDTVRIMLTGQADLETAISAINQGEIYRFFTKPCNEIDLAVAIRDALQKKQLIDRVKKLVNVVEQQAERIAILEGSTPGIMSVQRDASGTILIGEQEYDLDEICKEALEEVKWAESGLKGVR